VYWKLSEDGKVPSTWPDSLSTKINIDNPMNFTYMDNKYKLFIAVSIVLINVCVIVFSNCRKYMY